MNRHNKHHIQELVIRSLTRRRLPCHIGQRESRVLSYNWDLPEPLLFIAPTVINGKKPCERKSSDMPQDTFYLAVASSTLRFILWSPLLRFVLLVVMAPPKKEVSHQSRSTFETVVKPQHKNSFFPDMMTSYESNVSPTVSSEPLFVRNASRNTFPSSSSAEPLTTTNSHNIQSLLVIDETAITVSPNSSIDDETILSMMNVSIASSGDSIWSSLPPEKQASWSSFGSLGLPSQYPRHGRDGSGTTCTYPDDLDEFEEMQIQWARSSEAAKPAVNPLLTLEPAGPRPSINSKRRGSHRRSGVGSITSADQYKNLISDFNQRRRRRNEAHLSSGDYKEALRQELATGPISIEGKLEL